ncbi:CYTH domain-containing protein [Devosia nitrariae]|uniref:Adenylate cyclase n=1 Tax=Devosia nitrariae TaxID=2071872 RepID=A0ABQ5WCF5_9HYPH|nr:CYTH domain-containing protein [Devosia nitrariae]GLQ57558.1 adenylate cyclase [Devosia nitrariae]
MADEIERKFLVVSDSWRASVTRSMKLEQGYLAQSGGVSVRVRVRDEAEAFLTLKSGGSGLVRAEYEYAIPVADARELLALCVPHIIAKRRHLVPAGEFTWEVDVFEGRHAGLVVAEIELDAADTVPDLPDWIGKEVTADPRYYNAVLAAL